MPLEGCGSLMQLHSSEPAFIEKAKLCEYLLSDSHPVGRFKARFFARLGYRSADWRQLEEDLRTLLMSSEPECRTSFEFGVKFIVRGVVGVDEKSRIVTIWIIRNGENFPRFVTAYPEDGR